MEIKNLYESFTEAIVLQKKLLAILIDPDKFDVNETSVFLRSLPAETTHIFVGGSTVAMGTTKNLVRNIKLYTSRPVLIFPGDFTQITDAADGLLFLSLLSGRNPEYLIGQQLKAVPLLRKSALEVLSTAYILIDGGKESEVARISGTTPMSQENVQQIVDTAKAGVLMGAKLIYLEAGSGAVIPVSEAIIFEVKKEIDVPLIVGGGIRSEAQKQIAYNAGADMVVMGTVYEK
ncbi:MAG: geranylgeranylglyceryl phosphate synthase family protein [Flavobacteriaceae bacterium]|nr:geranylgeranylglyceryl phosphate synthase family protein [Flavobacteriaceae bacterium]